MPTPRFASALLLVLALLLGFGLRLAPSLRAPGTQFLSDGSAIARLAVESSSTGRLPAVDRLSEAPAGRPLGVYLSPGLIVSAGAFHRAMAALGSRSADWNLTLFGALCGALVAIPVFFAARALWGPGWAGPLAALIVSFLPAHLHRTFGYFLRYDALGSLLIAAHLALAFAALGVGRAGTRLLFALGSAALMLAAVWAWRVALFVPLLEAGFVAVLAVLRGVERAEREWLTVVAGVCTAGFPALEYLRAQAFPLSPAWLAAVAVAAALWLPPLARGRARGPARVAVVLVALALGVLAGRLGSGPSPYLAAASLLPAKLGGLLHVPVRVDAATLLLLQVEELGTLTPPALFVGAMQLSFLGPWFLASPLLFWNAARRPALRRALELRADVALLVWMCVSLTLLTLLLYRTKVLLGPLVAVALGGAIAGVLTPPKGVWRRGRGALLAAFALCLLATGWSAVIIARTRESRLPAGLAGALEQLGRERSGGAVMSLWERGFEIQSYAGRPTVVDGFLESRENLRRVVQLSSASMAPSADSLARLCARYGATDLLVPPPDALYTVALLTRQPFLRKLRSGAPLTPREADHVLIQMMVRGVSPAPFEKIYDRDGWRLYRLAPGPAVTNSLRASGAPPASEAEQRSGRP